MKELEKYKEKEKQNQKRKALYISKKYKNEVFSSEPDFDNENIIFDKFNRSTNGIKVMTGFTAEDFEELYCLVELSLIENGSKRGRKSKLSKKDKLLLLLTFLHSYVRLDKISMDFNVKSSCAIKTIISTANSIHDTLINEFVIPIKKHEQLNKNIILTKNPSVALIVDATVFPIQKPAMSFISAKAFYSEKHGFYCLKREVAVLPNGMAAFFSQCVPGAVHDFNLFKKRMGIYKEFLTKEIPDLSVNDNENMTQWALMGDKGYYGETCLRMILPPKNKKLTDEEKEIYGERIIVENYFGRLKGLFNILCSEYRGSHENFDLLIDICMALANWNIKKNPLRIDDYDFYMALKTEIYNEKNAIAAKEKMKYERKQIKSSLSSFSSFNSFY